jgi:hypothetical protein
MQQATEHLLQPPGIFVAAECNCMVMWNRRERILGCRSGMRIKEEEVVVQEGHE